MANYHIRTASREKSLSVALGAARTRKAKYLLGNYEEFHFRDEFQVNEFLSSIDDDVDGVDEELLESGNLNRQARRTMLIAQAQRNDVIERKVSVTKIRRKHLLFVAEQDDEIDRTYARMALKHITLSKLDRTTIQMIGRITGNVVEDDAWLRRLNREPTSRGTQRILPASVLRCRLRLQKRLTGANTQLNGNNGSVTNTDDHDNDLSKRVHREANTSRFRRTLGSNGGKHRRPRTETDSYSGGDASSTSSSTSAAHSHSEQEIVRVQHHTTFEADTLEFFKRVSPEVVSCRVMYRESSVMTQLVAARQRLVQTAQHIVLTTFQFICRLFGFNMIGMDDISFNHYTLEEWVDLPSELVYLLTKLMPHAGVTTALPNILGNALSRVLEHGEPKFPESTLVNKAILFETQRRGRRDRQFRLGTPYHSLGTPVGTSMDFITLGGSTRFYRVISLGFCILIFTALCNVGLEAILNDFTVMAHPPDEELPIHRPTLLYLGRVVYTLVLSTGRHIPIWFLACYDSLTTTLIATGRISTLLKEHAHYAIHYIGQITLSSITFKTDSLITNLHHLTSLSPTHTQRRSLEYMPWSKWLHCTFLNTQIGVGKFLQRLKHMSGLNSERNQESSPTMAHPLPCPPLRLLQRLSRHYLVRYYSMVSLLCLLLVLSLPTWYLLSTIYCIHTTDLQLLCTLTTLYAVLTTLFTMLIYLLVMLVLPLVLYGSYMIVSSIYHVLLR